MDICPQTCFSGERCRRPSLNPDSDSLYCYQHRRPDYHIQCEALLALLEFPEIPRDLAVLMVDFAEAPFGHQEITDIIQDHSNRIKSMPRAIALPSFRDSLTFIINHHAILVVEDPQYVNKIYDTLDELERGYAAFNLYWFPEMRERLNQDVEELIRRLNPPE